MTTSIQEDMKQQFTYLTKRQAYFLLESVEKPYIDSISDDFGIGTFFSLIERGWVYWFQVGEETRFVVPEELKKIIKETFFERELFLQLQKHHELSEYIEAFVNLYGVFELQHLLAVWNQHHPEDSFAQTQLEEYVEEATMYQLVFTREGNLVYAAEGISTTMAKMMIHKLSHTPYYVPKPEEISALADRKSSVHFKPLEIFVRSWTTLRQSEYVLKAVLDCVRLGLPPEAGVKEIELVLGGVVDFNNAALMDTFRLLYDRLFNDSRNWLSRGHTPAEFDQTQ